jgi:hypothetical protein
MHDEVEPVEKRQYDQQTRNETPFEDEEEDDEDIYLRKQQAQKTTHRHGSASSSGNDHLSQLRAFAVRGAPSGIQSSMEEEEDEAPILYSDDEDNNQDNEFRSRVKQIKNDMKSQQQTTQKRKYTRKTPVVATVPTPESPYATLDTSRTSAQVSSITPDLLLYKFVRSCSSDESLRRELIRDYESTHWVGIRKKFNMERSARKGRWSEHEINLIKKYSEQMRIYRQAVIATISGDGLQMENNEHVVNVTHVKHFIALIIGRGYDSFEVQWGKIVVTPPGENFCENIRVLKEVFDKELNIDQSTPKINKGLQQRAHEDEVGSLYKQLTTHMRLYQQCVMDYRSGKKSSDFTGDSVSFRELSQLISQHLERISNYHAIYDEQLHELLWKSSFTNAD